MKETRINRGGAGSTFWCEAPRRKRFNVNVVKIIKKRV